MINYLHENSKVKYRNLPHYPDYFPDNPGGKGGNRSMEPEPISGTKLGNDLAKLREQHPQTAFTMGPINMNFTQVEGQLLLGALPGWKSLFAKLITKYIFDIPMRFKWGWKDRRLTMGNAGVARLILSLKDGYDTVLGKGEQSVSVGESQLISFARALASPAPIIVLDEATASVDSLTEKKLQEGLRVWLKKKTSLVVAHRLSTIRHATRILALKDGEIIECGTHEALMKKNSFYANLYHCQFASFK